MKALLIKSLYFFICLLLITVHAEANSEKNRLADNGFFFVFNQPEYAPGDTAFFTDYLLRGESQQLRKREIVSVKLFESSGVIVQHVRILFQDGIGISQMIIPQSMKPGQYQFITYVETGFGSEIHNFYQGFITISKRGSLNTNERISNQPEVDSSKFNILTNQSKYGRRSKVSVAVSGKDEPENSFTALSMTVYSENLFKQGMNTVYSILQTRAIDSMDESKKSNLSSGKSDFPSYFMGKAIIKSSGNSVPDSSKIIFYLNESDFVYGVYTKDGLFTFPLFKNFGNEEVFYRISSNGRIIQDAQIILHETSFDAESIQSKNPSDSLDSYGHYARQKQFINQSYFYFVSKEKKKNEYLAHSDVETDHEILLEKFESFSSMAEIIGNVVPSVRYRKMGDEKRIRIFLKEDAKFGDDDPLYLVDGLMTDDTNYVLGIDPKFIYKIGVLRSEGTLARFGELGVNGILVIETNGQLAAEEIRNRGNSLSIVGISNPLDFRKKEYTPGKVTRRIPDLRSCLFWSPKIDSDKDNSFEFFTGDDEGYYIIQLAGILDGKPYLATKRFYVAPGQIE
jgi:hypothetical protein